MTVVLVPFPGYFAYYQMIVSVRPSFGHYLYVIVTIVLCLTRPQYLDIEPYICYRQNYYSQPAPDRLLICLQTLASLVRLSDTLEINKIVSIVNRVKIINHISLLGSKCYTKKTPRSNRDPARYTAYLKQPVSKSDLL